MKNITFKLISMFFCAVSIFSLRASTDYRGALSERQKLMKACELHDHLSGNMFMGIVSTAAVCMFGCQTSNVAVMCAGCILCYGTFHQYNKIEDNLKKIQNTPLCTLEEFYNNRPCDYTYDFYGPVGEELRRRQTIKNKKME